MKTTKTIKLIITMQLIYIIHLILAILYFVFMDKIIIKADDILDNKLKN